jgi:hypothetical protein
MIRPPNPASDTANVDALLADVRGMRRRLDELEAAVATGVKGRTGAVSAFTGGSTTLTATMDGGGTAQCRYLSGYTPVVGHRGLILIWPGVNLWVGRDSIP